MLFSNSICMMIHVVKVVYNIAGLKHPSIARQFIIVTTLVSKY